MVRQAMPPASNTNAATADRRARRGGWGRPDSADMIGWRAIVRAGHHAAATEVATARPAPPATTHQGMSKRSRRRPTARSRAGTNSDPRSERDERTGASRHDTDRRASASMTGRTCRSVAPAAASRPSWRWRRWAMTTKAAAATRATRSIATVAAISTPMAASVFSLEPRGSMPQRDGAAGERNSWTRSSSARIRIVAD